MFDQHYYFVIVSLGILLFFTSIAFVSPRFSFVFMVTLGILLSFTTFPWNAYNSTKRIVPLQESFLWHLLVFLNRTNILEFFCLLYIKYFCVLDKIFYKRLYILIVASILAVLFAKWYLIQSVFMKNNFSTFTLLEIYLLSFLSIAIVYFRLALNIAMFLIFKTLATDKSLLSLNVLYVLGEEPNDLNDPNTKRSFIDFSYHRHRHYHAHNYAYKDGQMCIAVSTCLLAFGTLYYAKIQANEAVKQSYHTAREADATAVSEQLISQEEYYRRHPQDRPYSSTKK